MQSLESMAHSLNLDKEGLEKRSPGHFVDYNQEKDRSSSVTLASSGGMINKTKKRSLFKTIYEVLAMDVWNRVLRSYSEAGDLQFRAPEPIGISVEGEENTSLYMGFLNGYKVKSFGNLKRTTPVRIKGQREPLPLYPACALHLGALNGIKENEELYHSDYDGRHVFFSPIENVSMGVIDVENSRVEPDPTIVSKESDKMLDLFRKYTSSVKDRAVIDTWYHQGKENLVLPEGGRQIERALDETQKRYDVEFDMVNMKINGQNR
tara:strand:+ start:2258 stop:3049 length:792 start_codon:yes stop_codon:yes gene_type:complete